MDFDFSQDEKMIREQVRKMLSARCDSGAVRSVFEGREAYASHVWQGLVEMGVMATAIP